MKNVLNIFKQDVRNITRVPLLIILLLALTVLPSLYAWFNLGSAWDPYANTSGIQVAVVNNDEGAEIEGEPIHIGEGIVESLKDNNDFGWKFISKQAAEDGVKNGDIYAAIYIEQGFSSDLVSVLEGNPEQAEIVYQVNEKINAIAPKMTSAGASTVVTKMNEQLIEETSKALFDQFDELGIKIEEELPTMRKMKKVVEKIEVRFPEIHQFADRLIEVEENWVEIDGRVDQFLGLEDYMSDIEAGAERIYGLEARLPEINQLGEQILQLESSIPELEKAVEQLSTVGERFSETAEQLESGLKKTNAVRDSINSMQDTVLVLLKRREHAEEYLYTVQSVVEEAFKLVEATNEMIAEQLQYLNEIAQLTDTVLAGLENEESLEQASEYLAELNEQVTHQIQMIDQIITLYELFDEEEQSEQVQALLQKLKALREAMVSLQEALDTLQMGLDTGPLDGEKLAVARESAQDIEEATQVILDLLNSEAAADLISAFTEMMGGFEQSDSEMLETFSDLDALEDVLIQADEVVNTSEETIESLIGNIPEMEERIQELIGKIEKELPTVVNTIERFAEFAEEELPLIEAGVNNVAEIMRNDFPMAKGEYDRISVVLTEQVPEVRASLQEINRYSREYLPEFSDVIHETAERFREIEEEDQINRLIAALRNDLDEESKFFANPIELKEERLFEIPNYGSANTPFYTVLSIWVGALLLSNLITTNVHPIDMRPEYTLRHIYFGKMILFLIVGLLQGFIVSTGNILLLGVFTAHPILFVLFSMFISVIFMTIVYTLASILGNIGKGLAIILLVLQLSSSGGTFPVDVLPPFFQAIHPYMPFTYAINLMREAVGGAIPMLVLKNISFLLLFMVLAFIVGVVLKPLLAKRIEATFEKSKSSRLVE